MWVHLNCEKGNKPWLGGGKECWIRDQLLLSWCYLPGCITFDTSARIDNPGKCINHADRNANLQKMPPVWLDLPPNSNGFVAKTHVAKADEFFSIMKWKMKRSNGWRMIPKLLAPLCKAWTKNQLPSDHCKIALWRVFPFPNLQKIYGVLTNLTSSKGISTWF